MIDWLGLTPAQVVGLSFVGFFLGWVLHSKEKPQKAPQIIIEGPLAPLSKQSTCEYIHVHRDKLGRFCKG